MEDSDFDDLIPKQNLLVRKYDCVFTPNSIYCFQYSQAEGINVNLCDNEMCPFDHACDFYYEVKN